MNSESDARQLERLRRLRVESRPDPGLGPEFERAAASLRRSETGVGRIAGAWEAVCPRELIERTRIARFSGGVVTIIVPDAAARYELDRFLRSGGERAFIEASPTPVRKILLRHGPIG